MSLVKVLIIGHSLVVDENRQIWNVLAKNFSGEVDLLVPKRWKSNLIKDLHYSFNQETDDHINRIISIKCYFKGNGSFFFFRLIPFWWLLLRNQYDGIFIDQESWSLSMLQLKITRWFTKNRKTRVMLNVAQNIKKVWLYPLSLFERFNTSSVDMILGCSREIKDVIRWKGIKKPCKYFPLSYDSNKYQPVEREVESDELVIGYMGRLSEEKGIKNLVESIEVLRKQKIKIRLVVAGAGPLVDYLSRFIFVDYLGAIPHRDAYLFYRKIDIFVLPSLTTKSWKEQFGRVIVEAVASGRLVVGSDSGSIPEVMGKLKMPYVFQEESVLDLTLKLKRAIGDLRSGKAKRIIEISIDICHKLFSHQSVASRFSTYLTTRDEYDEI